MSTKTSVFCQVIPEKNWVNNSYPLKKEKKTLKFGRCYKSDIHQTENLRTSIPLTLNPQTEIDITSNPKCDETLNRDVTNQAVCKERKDKTSNTCNWERHKEARLRRGQDRTGISLKRDKANQTVPEGTWDLTSNTTNRERLNKQEAGQGKTEQAYL